MHFIYKSIASWDGTAIVGDIVKMLTNDLNIAGYSNNCDKVGTSVLNSTTPGGWEMWDASPGQTNAYVLRALESNGATYKYMLIRGTLSTLIFTGYTAWNPVTHTGTNPTSNTIGIGLVTNANPYTIMIWQTASYIGFLSGSGGVWNTPVIIGGELDRATTTSDWYASTSNSAMVTSIILPGVQPSSSITMGVMYGPFVTNTGAFGVQQAPVSGATFGSVNQPARNIDESIGPHVIFPLYVVTNVITSGFGNTPNYNQLQGSMRNILLLHSAASLAPLDEINISGTLYSVAKSSSPNLNNAFLIPKV